MGCLALRYRKAHKIKNTTKSILLHTSSLVSPLHKSAKCGYSRPHLIDHNSTQLGPPEMGDTFLIRALLKGCCRVLFYYYNNVSGDSCAGEAIIL